MPHLLRPILFSVLFNLTFLFLSQADSTVTVYPDDTRISYSDYVTMSFVTSPFDSARKLARFDRVLDMTGKGYRWDSPGTRIRFRTDATSIQVLLYYNELHISTTARNSIGFYLVDGVGNAAWTFRTVATTTVRATEQVAVTITPGAAGSFHDYEVILPYADSVDLQGVTVNATAQFATPTARPALRYLAYGDSVTQGFTATDAMKGYGFLVAQKNNWQAVNLGMAGRGSTASDGTVVAQQGANIISVLMGVNDWQGGTALETYRSRMTAFFNNLRTVQPYTPVYAITPLWVDASWVPSAPITDLENYRQVLREVVAARNDPNLYLVEGPDLIDHSKSYFDAVLVHPNNAGFAMMADRLAAIMAAKPATVTGLNAAPGTSAGQIVLNWSAAAGATSYLIERSVTTSTGFTQVGQVNVPTLTFTDAGNRTASQVYYRMRAQNPGGTSGYSVEASSVAYLPAGMDGWRYVNFGTTSSSDPLAADLATPNHDGITNLMAYALGLSAAAPNSPAKLPVAQSDLVGGLPTLTMTFTHSKGASDAQVVVEVANQLSGTWSTINPFLAANQVSVSDNTPAVGVETITVKDSQPLSASTQRFMRLRVTRN